ncbi:hypothetical protein EPH95_01415 [Salicibibacter halophilus]|uniref:Uncharacterized protein n=1 Tax=Salicibibacter halophilus TaxID=2502791 RepID=A0A514LEL1_9BACI|nr:hypothetical protein [Salicibibacter halophilus]QDI89995.1 hypothetical protein EPH95_01415 [Salicibibacter halophilus]
MKTKFIIGLMAMVLAVVPTNIAHGNVATTPHDAEPFLVNSIYVLASVTIVYFIVSMFKDND